MCHITGFQKILDINYTRIGLSINVKLSLGKLLGTRQKTIQSRSQEIQNHARSYRMLDQKYFYWGIRRKLPWLNSLHYTIFAKAMFKLSKNDSRYLE